MDTCVLSCQGRCPWTCDGLTASVMPSAVGTHSDWYTKLDVGPVVDQLVHCNKHNTVEYRN